MERACCPPKGIRRIRVGDFEAGVTGLDQALEEARREGRLPADRDLGPHLVAILRRAGNYIPQSEESVYAEALVRLYADFVAEKKQGSNATQAIGGENKMKIEILGPGCARCRATEGNVRKALAELKLDAEILHITDLLEISKRRVMLTPGVLIDGALRSSGRVPTVEEIKQWLQPVPTSR